MGNLLMRGMLAGLLAGLLAFAFAKVVGEPQVERAIAFEEHLTQAAGEAHEPQIVSRTIQSTVGLLTGILVYGSALGGMFALTFAFINGRLLRSSPRLTAVLLAAVGFLVLYAVPYLKYPASPPSVGQPDTIAYRTELYFGMIVFSLAAMAIAISLGNRIVARHGAWNATLAGIATYLALAGTAAIVLPSINEVPEAFPSDLLWQFRLAALGTQVVLWTALALIFGLLVESHGSRSARLASGRQ